jgi:hypothetical protein
MRERSSEIFKNIIHRILATFFVSAHFAPCLGLPYWSMVRCGLHKLVLKLEGVRNERARKLNLNSIGRACLGRTWLHADNSTDFIDGNVETEAHSGLIPEPDG